MGPLVSHSTTCHYQFCVRLKDNRLWLWNAGQSLWLYLGVHLSPFIYCLLFKVTGIQQLSFLVTGSNTFGVLGQEMTEMCVSVLVEDQCVNKFGNFILLVSILISWMVLFFFCFLSANFWVDPRSQLLSLNGSLIQFCNNNWMCTWKS